MHMEPFMLPLVGSILALLLIGLVLKRFDQPLVIGYLLAGVILGPHATAVISDTHLLEQFGAIGVLLLLFFVGMEISPQALVSRWRVALVGTALQIGISVGLVGLAGLAFGWDLPRIVLLGFVISLSSTAVVLRLLHGKNGESPEVAGDVTAVLLAQDLALVPMMIVLGLFQGEALSITTLSLQAVGTLGTIGLMVWIYKSGEIRLPFNKAMESDSELQVFVALLFCFGFAVLTAVFQLSAALGAFLGGIVVGAAKQTERFHEQLKSFEVVFVAIFFVSIGMLIDLDFLQAQWLRVGALVLLVLLTNTGVNAIALRLLGTGWAHSLKAAALLSQVGEFSFVLALVGYRSGIIGEFGYQATLSVISVSLLVSPAWIALVNRCVPRTLPVPAEAG